MGVRRQPDGMSEANLQRSHPRLGASKGDITITMITSGASCRDAAASR
ncbi:MAG: hypothetical protein MR575_02305 [Bacteroides sp.]|nr:hypothetical protein [Bacteroides sp.]